MKQLTPELRKKIEKYILNDWPDSIIQSQLQNSMGTKISVSIIKKIRDSVIKEGFYDPLKTKHLRKNGANPPGDECIIFEVDEKQP